MKYEKKFHLNGKIFHLNFNDLFYKKKNIYIFGCPFNIDKNKINEKYISKNLKEFYGYFFIIIKKKNSIIFITDVLANKRVYYQYNGKKILISDQINNLSFKRKNFDKDIFNFFKLKNYTPGNLTFFKNIKKFQPCTKYEFKENCLKQKIYFKNIINEPNKDHLLKKIDKYLSKTLIFFKKKNVILLYSGGKDSTLILKYLLKLKIKFTPIYLSTHPRSFETEKNIQNAKMICSQNNLKLKIVKINLSNYFSINKIIKKNFLFDYHFSFLFYKGLKEIYREYGKDIFILSGQSLDSILSFGPSQKTIGNFFARYMNYYPLSIVSKFMSLILSLKFKKKLTVSKTKENFFENFYFNYFYYPVSTELKLSENFFSYLRKITKHLKDDISKKMYLKIHGFLQGSDNMVLINSAKLLKNNKIFMPFGTLKFISIICKYYDFQKDVFYPKYLINLLEPELNYNDKKIKNLKLKLSILNEKIKLNVIKSILKSYDKKN